MQQLAMNNQSAGMLSNEVQILDASIHNNDKEPIDINDNQPEPAEILAHSEVP